MEHLNELQFNDYLDDLLSESEQGAVHAHLAGCAECRAEAEVLRSVLADVRALPKGVKPARDLLPGIHAAIGARQVTALDGWRTRSLWSLRVPLAAAAVMLVVASVVVTRIIDQRAPAATFTQAPNGSSVLVSQQVNDLETRYEGAIAELQQMIDAQRAQLSPSTIRVLEENLRVIDRAIRESRAALQADPANEMVNEMLRSGYEKKLELLRRATSVVST
jgi:Putative zinc-finger